MERGRLAKYFLLAMHHHCAAVTAGRELNGRAPTRHTRRFSSVSWRESSRRFGWRRKQFNHRGNVLGERCSTRIRSKGRLGRVFYLRRVTRIR